METLVLFLTIALGVVLLVQSAVIEQQKIAIRTMSENPACLVAPHHAPIHISEN